MQATKTHAVQAMHATQPATLDPVQLHACAENQLSRARVQLSGAHTNYKAVANQLRAALEAVLALGTMDAKQLNAGGRTMETIYRVPAGSGFAIVTVEAPAL